MMGGSRSGSSPSHRRRPWRRYFRHLPNREGAKLARAMKPLVPGDAMLCSDGANGCAKLASTGGIEHFIVGSRPGTRVAAGCHQTQNLNSLHARYNKFIKPFCGPATKNLNGYIQWLEVRPAGTRPAEIFRAS